MNGCAPGLALKERLKTTRKWAIGVARTSDEGCMHFKWASLVTRFIDTFDMRIRAYGLLPVKRVSLRLPRGYAR